MGRYHKRSRRQSICLSEIVGATGQGIIWRAAQTLMLLFHLSPHNDGDNADEAQARDFQL